MFKIGLHLLLLIVCSASLAYADNGKGVSGKFAVKADHVQSSLLSGIDNDPDSEEASASTELGSSPAIDYVTNSDAYLSPKVAPTRIGSIRAPPL